VDALGEPPQFLDRILEVGLGSGNEPARLGRLLLDHTPRVLELQRDRDELLLCTIVEIALDRPASGIGRARDSGARLLHLSQPNLLGQIAEGNDRTAPPVELDRG
jgi:hypothetical protein